MPTSPCLHLLVGRAGSGKTTHIFEQIAHAAEQEQGRQLIIVPEMHSHAMERRLAQATQNHAGRTAEVLSFRRLAVRVFSEVGGLASDVLTPAGRLLTLQRAAVEVADELQVWKGIDTHADLLREALALIDECKTCAVSAEQLRGAQQKSDTDGLGAKLSDLSALLGAYEQRCAHTIPDPRDQLTRLCALVPRSRALDGVQIYFDGFLSFTPQEFCVVRALLARGLSVTMAVTADLSCPSVFVTGCRTVRHMERMADELRVRVEQTNLGQSRMARPHDLAVLEQHALLPVRRGVPAHGQGVSLFAASGPFAECEHAAATIRRLVRAGADYRDVVIAARSMDAYLAPLSMALARYEIPYFIAEKPDILSRPPVLLLTSALEAVCTGLRYEPLFTCLKTGLAGAEDAQICALEEYVTLWRIAGAAWERPWTWPPGGYGRAMTDRDRAQLDALNAVREQVIAPFIQLRDALHGSKFPLLDGVRALYEFLCAVHAPDRIAARAAAHGQAGRLQQAEEYRQLWEIVVSALEQMAWVGGDLMVEREGFADMVKLVLREYEVGVIPVGLDRVSCGEIDRVCAQPARYVILLGVNDGALPRAPEAAGLLSELDRDKLDRLGVALSAHGNERMLMEQEIVYRALACPREHLYLSYHTADSEGKQALPSYLVGVVRRLLPGVPEQDTEQVHMRDRLEAERPALECACAYLSGAHTAGHAAAYAHYQEHAQVQRARRWVDQRTSPPNDTTALQALFALQHTLHASRVEAYYKCSFAHFVQYGLAVLPRASSDLNLANTGTFLHDILEKVLKKRYKKHVGADTLDLQCNKQAQTYACERFGGLDDKNARFRLLYERLTALAVQVLRDVTEELDAGDFVPLDYELSFRDGKQGARGLPSVTVQGERLTARLEGKVDRVDGWLDEDTLYVRIMDYKSGKKKFRLSDLWYGLNMQLLIYLHALCTQSKAYYTQQLGREIARVVPAGVLYVPVRDPIVSLSEQADADTIKQKRRDLLRRSGVLLSSISVLEHMEHSEDENKEKGKRRFLPIKIKKSESKQGAKADEKKETVELTAEGSSRALDRTSLVRLMEHTCRKLLEVEQAMAQGKVEVAPHQEQHGALCCTWCDYRAACHFDPSAGDRARIARKLSENEFWNKLTQEENAYASVDTTTTTGD